MHKQDGFLYTQTGQQQKYKNIIEEVKNIFDNDLIIGVWVVVEKKFNHSDKWQSPNHEYYVAHDGVAHDAEDILIEFVNGKFMGATNSEWGGIFAVEEDY